jgi:CheY-like chemotaxis protein
MVVLVAIAQDDVVSGLVLVVDDVEDVRELWIHCFTEAGFAVEAAADGVEAVALATSTRPVAVVMDLQMPNMDGFDAARRIREILGAAPYMIGVSAHAGDGSRREAYEAGFDDLVTKPMAPNVLITIVRAALRSRAT